MSNQESTFFNTIESLANNKASLKAVLGEENAALLLFHLEEIAIDIDNFEKYINALTSDSISKNKLSELVDGFLYSSLPHMKGHLESLEKVIDND